MMQSQILQHITGVSHEYSFRSAGDMRDEENRKLFVHQCILPEQVHGNTVVTIVDSSQSKISGADGLVTNQTGITLGVLVADCVPILLADAKRRVVAAVHAGWKGTLGDIAAVAVDTMRSNPQDIVVSIGPHIGPCCYTVSKERSQLFDPSCSYNNDGVWHVDIGLANKIQLMDAGVDEDSIELSLVCTSCQSDIFYSYRKDSKELSGRILAVISMKK